MDNGAKTTDSFNLLRWFSIASFLALLPVAGATAFFLSYFITEHTLQRDASQTAQFIQNCVEVEGRHLGPGLNNTAFSELLDRRVDPRPLGFTIEAVELGRKDVMEHLRSLPDVLLSSMFAKDGTIIWSTNPSLIGQVSKSNDELQEAFRSQVQVARHHAGNQTERAEQKFMVQPKEFFIENYIPLHNAKGEVVLVVEVYKEPKYLISAIEQGRRLVWGGTLLAGALAYLCLFSIVRRGSTLLQQQHRQLVETDALVFVGEMSTAVAHSLRNPLASIRSSAELALSTEDEPVRKNARDIITQVDFLSKWVRELLLFTRPESSAPEPVDLVAVIDSVLGSFAAPCAKAGIVVEWDRDKNRPKVKGNTSLLTQVLHSILSNAIEAMPQGGKMRIAMRIEKTHNWLELTVGDTGGGMSEKQMAMAFKPFHTTKRNGLGVGLTMVKRGMERFGGTVTLSSRENGGTEVRLEFRMA